MSKLEIGKLPNELLKSLILSRLGNQREEVIMGPSIGEDAAILDFKEDLIVLSSDPITGSTKNLGSLAVHINVNDVATQAADPVGILFTLLLPEGTTADEVEQIMNDAQREANKLKIDIIGGHTEVTKVVNQPLLVATVIAKVDKDHRPKKELVQAGDVVAISKVAALEGTAILAHELEDQLTDFLDDREMKHAKSYMEEVSVLKEGQISKNYNIRYLHDVTEGGLLGALWESAVAIDKGIDIYEECIPVDPVTKKMAQKLSFDPLKMISSGSMLFIMDKNDFQDLKKDLASQQIHLTAVGEVTDDKSIRIERQGQWHEIESPGADELYKFV